MMNKIILLLLAMAFRLGATAQSFSTYTSGDGKYMKRGHIKLSGHPKGQHLHMTPCLSEDSAIFKAWGTCMNELDWDALQTLNDTDRETLLDKLFTADGLGYTMGRIPMNGNDYSRSWYECDSVDGDFSLLYFNIDRDKEATIPLIKAAIKRCPGMTFWMSPWSPPSWMKINHHYAVQSSRYNDLDPRKDYLLFCDNDRSVNEQVKPDRRLFPRRLACQPFFIQEPRYLQTYADMFCRFIDAYSEQGIPISMVMYQNEAYSYTNYPGCPWTTDAILRFNIDYLGPTLEKKHPEVELWLGTFNTNRYEHVSELLANSRIAERIKGIGVQWEGRQLLSRLRENFPSYEYMSSESECGWGSFDWKSAEHTFFLMTDYIGNGCTRYTFWNAVLCDEGLGPWGWKQNALVRVDSKAHSYTLTPEYYAVWHFAHFVRPGSRLLSFVSAEKGVNAIIFLSPAGKYIVITNNATDEAQSLSIALGKKYLNITLQPHTIQTCAGQ